MTGRRTVLGTLAGLVGMAGTAGCLRLSGDETSTPSNTPTPTGISRDTPPTETVTSPATSPGLQSRTAADWRQYQVDAANSGVHPDAIGPSGDLTEQWRAARPGWGYTSPVVLDGTAYTGRLGSLGLLRAFDLEGGEMAWERRLGESIVASPTVADGAVVVPTNAPACYAIDVESGEVRWRTPLEDGTVHRSAPTAVGSTVYLGCHGAVYALETGTGTIRWRTGTDGDAIATPAVAFGHVFVGRPSGSIQALRTDDGSVAWTYDAGVAVRMPPALRNGIVYAADRNGTVHAVDGADGTALWTADNGSADRFTDADGNPRPVADSPAISEQTLYVTQYRQGVVAFDRSSGDRRWFQATMGRARAAPVVVDGVVYVKDQAGLLSLFDAESGEILGTGFEVQSNSPYPPVVTGGLVLLPSRGFVALAEVA